MKKKILITIILIMFCTLAFCQCVKAEEEVKTTIQIKEGATCWTGISVSDAYDKCQELNEDDSALGKTGDNVIAHLSTNADWYAVSLLTISAYGGGDASRTSGNKSGVINFGSKRVFTAAIAEDNTKEIEVNYQSIIDNKNTKFVELIKANRDDNAPGLGIRTSENIQGHRGFWENWKLQDQPIVTRFNLFATNIGNQNNATGGGPNSDTTFRPVIWVK